MVFQTMLPAASFAKESTPYQGQKQGEQLNRVKLGTLGEKDYPKIDTKTMLAINKQKRDELNGKPMERGVQTFAAPWFPNQREPNNDEKNKLYGKIHANFKLEGLNDNGTSKPFDWAGVFGLDEEGNPRKATIVFEQFDYKTGTRTGITNTMEVDRTGKFTWSDEDGKPVELPLYNRDTFEPYNYEVYLVQEKSKHVQLLTTGTISTEGGTTFEKPDANGKIVANVVLTFGLEQVASTKFVSEWNTDTKEEDRPNVEFSFYTKKGPKDEAGIFELPKNNTDTKIIRKYGLKGDGIFVDELKNVPEVEIADPDPDDPNKYEKDTIDFDRGGIYEDDVIKYKGHYYKYDFKYDVINGGKLTMTEIVPTTFDPSGGVFDDFYIRKDKDKPYVIWVEYGGSILDKIPKNVKKDGKQFLGWSSRKKTNVPDSIQDFKKITRPFTYYPVLSKDVIEYNPDDPQGQSSYDNFVRVHVDLTKKAKLGTGDKKERHFKVDPTHRVTLPVQIPNGEEETDADGRKFTWKFSHWKEIDKNNKKPVTRKWKVNDEDNLIKDSFNEETWIEAVYEKDYTKNDEAKGVGKTYAESSKDVNGNFINNLLPTWDKIKEQVTIKGKPIPNDVIITYIPGQDSNGNTYANYDAEIYDKLKEKENKKENGVEKPVRIESIKAELKFPDGEKKTVEIPLRVIKNIYEAKTGSDRPYYVPDNYKKVTLDPTPMAENPQKTYYYVNPEAKVVIPGKNPTGKGESKFIKWTYDDNGAVTEYKLAEKPRHKFTTDTIITAQYVADVIPQTGNTKPDHVPVGFVSVKFVPTSKAKDETDKIFWVNPEKEVTITIADPVGKDGASFKEWKIGENADGEVYDPKTKTQFNNPTIITATYLQDVIPKISDDGTENTKPNGFVEVKFVAGAHGKLKKADEEIQEVVFFVNPEKYVSLKAPTDLAKGDTGYEFGSWNPDVTNYLKFTKNTTIKANFNEQGALIPKVDENTEKPDGYKTVTFVIDPAEGGKINDGEITTYFVNPNKDVSITPPKTTANTGYKFIQWDQDTTTAKNYPKDTTVKGSFSNINDIIPATDVNGKPEGYVTVTFKADANGSLSGDTVFYVNSKKEVNLEETAKRIGKNPNAGYTANGGTWDVDATKKFKNTFTADTTFTFSFKQLADPDRIQMRDGDILTTPIDVFVGDEIKDDSYSGNLKMDDGRTIEGITVDTPADTSRPGYTSALITAKLSDGSTAKTKVLVFVKERCQQCPAPNPSPNPSPDPYYPYPYPLYPGSDDDSPRPPKGGDDERVPEGPKEDKPSTDDDRTPDKEKDKTPEEKEKTPENKDNKPEEKNKTSEEKNKTPEEKNQEPKDRQDENSKENSTKDKEVVKEKVDETVKVIEKTTHQAVDKAIKTVATGVDGTKKTLAKVFNPHTGIISHYELYLGIMAASSVGLFFTRDKKKKDEE